MKKNKRNSFGNEDKYSSDPFKRPEQNQENQYPHKEKSNYYSDSQKFDRENQSHNREENQYPYKEKSNYYSDRNEGHTRPQQNPNDRMDYFNEGERSNEQKGPQKFNRKNKRGKAA